MTDRDTHHYTTKELYIRGYEEHEFEECAKMTCSVTSQIDYTIENMTFQKKTKKLKQTNKNLLGSESNSSLLCDRQGYSPLYYQGIGIEEHEFEECGKMTGSAQAFTNLYI